MCIFCQVLGDIERKIVVYAACEDAHLPGETDNSSYNMELWGCWGVSGHDLSRDTGKFPRRDYSYVNINYSGKWSKNHLWDNDLGEMYNSVRWQPSGNQRGRVFYIRVKTIIVQFWNWWRALKRFFFSFKENGVVITAISRRWNKNNIVYPL